MAPRVREIREYQRIRTVGARGGKEEKRERERERERERDWEKLAHITVCIFADTCTFAPWILEKDDYLHRDTFSLSQLVYLLIYFLVLRVYPSLLPLAALSPPLSSYFLSFLLLLLLLFLLLLFSFFVFSSSSSSSSSFPDSSLPRASTIRRKVFTLHRDPIVASVKISEFHRNGKRGGEKSTR